MTTIDHFEHELPAALSDVAGTGRPDYLTDILGRTAHTRQRPAWASLERWLPMDLTTARAPVARVPWRPIVVVALLALLLVALLAVYAGSQRHVPPPFGPATNGVIPYDVSGDVFVADPISGATRLLVGGPENDYIPTFSPDGTHVYFLRAASDCPTPGDVCPGGESIVVVGADGSGARVISGHPLVGLRVATWVPDSHNVLVGYDDGGVFRLVELPIDGGTPRQIAEGFEVDWAVFRPPSGDELLLRGLVDGTFGLYAMNADGSNLRLLANAAEPGETFADNQDLNFPAYAPDGSRIYFNRLVPAAQTIQAWVMNPDGSNPHRFNESGPTCCWWEGELAPSPDGTSVLMWRVSPNSVDGGGVTLYPADGTGPGRVIGPDLPDTGHWAWSPDSTRVLLNHNDAAQGGQVLIDAATGTWSPAPWGDNAEPDWQRTAR